MNGYKFHFCGETLVARGDGSLFWPQHALLVVSDLHLGKSERIARRSGAFLPPYETLDTLARLKEIIDTLRPQTILSLGDSFDDDTARSNLAARELDTVYALTSQANWIWISGNHDPQQGGLPGQHLDHTRIGPLNFRHIAESKTAPGEVSGHFHPKVTVPLRGRQVSRKCFLIDKSRLILPAFGTYTGGLRCDDPALSRLFCDDATAILTGQTPHPIPVGAYMRNNADP